MVLFQSESANTRGQVILRISDNDGKYSEVKELFDALFKMSD